MPRWENPIADCKVCHPVELAGSNWCLPWYLRIRLKIGSQKFASADGNSIGPSMGWCIWMDWYCWWSKTFQAPYDSESYSLQEQLLKLAYYHIYCQLERHSSDLILLKELALPAWARHHSAHMNSPSWFLILQVAFSVRRIKMEAFEKLGFRCSWLRSVDWRLDRCRSWRCLKKRCYSCCGGWSMSCGCSCEGERAAEEIRWRSGWFHQC